MARVSFALFHGRMLVQVQPASQLRHQQEAMAVGALTDKAEASQSRAISN